jgi:hypothetical protein
MQHRTWSLGPVQDPALRGSAFNGFAGKDIQGFSSTEVLQNIKFQYSMTKTKSRFGILKLGTRLQGGESKRSADNFGHCDLFDICDL